MALWYVCSGSQPLGVPHESSYSGGSQREYGMFAAPHLGCCLNRTKHTDTSLPKKHESRLKTALLMLLRAPLSKCGPVVALSCDGSVALRQTVGVTAGFVQLCRAARHMQQILHLSFTQQLFENRQPTQHLHHTTATYIPSRLKLALSCCLMSENQIKICNNRLLTFCFCLVPVRGLDSRTSSGL